jgi:hypothetical protein
MTKFTDAIYGSAPVNLGRIELDTSEMMFWLYLPVKMPKQDHEVLPKQLEKFMPILDAVACDLIGSEPGRWDRSYIYLSVKITHVTPDAPGNRPGWHSDGFLTDDLNYIWADRNPTQFLLLPEGKEISTHADHTLSMRDFEGKASIYPEYQLNGQANTLYRLDQTVIHRVSPNVETGKRAFIKVSVSDKPYVQLGNSINHDLPAHPLPTLERKADRNCPQGNA